MNFDTHQSEKINHVGGFNHAALIARNNPCSRPFIRSLRYRSLALQIKILQETFFAVCHKIHR